MLVRATDLKHRLKSLITEDCKVVSVLINETIEILRLRELFELASLRMTTLEVGT